MGTDGVLLGSWAGQNILTDTNLKVLDIGTGTGLIALMMAQRFSMANVQAIEISEQAYQQALINFQNSPWPDRLELNRTPLQSFETDHKYDLIVSNPPFFYQSKLSGNRDKDLARHTSALTLNDLLSFVKAKLRPNGLFGIILPADQKELLLSTVASFQMGIRRICMISPTPKHDAKRIMIECSLETIMETITEQLIIESNGRHQYSEEYCQLTHEFYLNF